MAYQNQNTADSGHIVWLEEVHPVIRFNRSKVSFTPEVIYLDITVDRKLLLKQHVKQRTAKIKTYRLDPLIKADSGLPIRISLALYIIEIVVKGP